MGSILGLTSILLLVRPVHLQCTGSTPQENDLLSMKESFNQYYKQGTNQMNNFIIIIAGD